MDDVRRAYAVFGLPEGSPYADVRKRYKELVKKWHPDRFASDPQGQREASLRLQVINAAYAMLERRHHVSRAPRPEAPSSPGRQARPAGRRLTPEEIDAIVAAIGSDGPLDELFRLVTRIGSPIESVMNSLLSRWRRRGRK